MQRRIIFTLFTLILLIGLALLGANLFTSTQASASAGGGASIGASLLNASGAARVNPTTPVAAIANGCGTLSFTETYSFTGGTAAYSPVVADFNGDGNLDLAVKSGNGLSSFVSVRLGDGMGGLGAATPFPVRLGTRGMTAGDFNGDGKLDLATSNDSSTPDTISILLGDGMGSFGPKTDFTAGGENPVSIAAGDFNEDGKLDLVTTNAFNASSNVSLYLGDGAGNFPSFTNFIAGTTPFSVVVGDFNADNNLDLAVANASSHNVSILLGNGMGSFDPATNFGVGFTPQRVTTGDFNGDGKLDLATANFSSDNVSILLGNGAGGFGPATAICVGNLPTSVTASDLNGDGKLDLIVGHTGADEIRILRGDGMGGFIEVNQISVGDAQSDVDVAVGDFNGDNKLDLGMAVSNFVISQAASKVSVLLNTCAPNNPPTIGSVAVSKERDTSANLPIANVSDPDQAADTLSVSISSGCAFGASASLNGVTVSNITVDAMGVVKADVAATCGATNANFTLKVTDSPGEPAITPLSVTVTPETEPPVITLNGANPMTVECATGFSDPGATATDNCTSGIMATASGSVNTSVTGTYTITYNATDAAGNPATPVTRTINVVDTTAPVITLNGADPMTVECPTSYSEPGATATDNCGVSVPVTITGTVNTGVPGAYTITYKAKDAANNETMKTRTVNVVDTTKPTLTLKSFPTPFPNDHKYRTFKIADMVASVSDGCNTALSVNNVVIDKVTSDEPDDSPGDDGNTTDDIVIAAGCKSVQLRAERDGKKNGRVYVVTLLVKDASGNTTRADFKVSVPISQNGTLAVADAAAQTKTGACP